MTQFYNRFVIDETGATAVEYSLIAALISAIIIAAVTGLGNENAAVWGKVDSTIGTAINKT
jgi:pilus assembly protein Flp/PilA